MQKEEQERRIIFPSMPLYMGSITTYSGPGQLGPLLVKERTAMHATQRSLIQSVTAKHYTPPTHASHNMMLRPMRSFSTRALKIEPLIRACPFRVSPSMHTAMAQLEGLNISCYPAHPMEAYNYERGYGASRYFTAQLHGYRSLLVTLTENTIRQAAISHVFRFVGVVCDVYVDRHLLVVRTTYEVYAAMVLSTEELQSLTSKLGHHGKAAASYMFVRGSAGFYYRTLLHYVQMDRSICRVAVNRTWSDIAAVKRTVYIAVTHWNGVAKVLQISDNLLHCTVDRLPKCGGASIGQHYFWPAHYLIVNVSLPVPVPYTETLTPMRYAPLPSPEPLPLFSGIYPSKLYVAYGSNLYSISIPEYAPKGLNQITAGHLHKPILAVVPAELEAIPALTPLHVGTHFCEIGERNTFTAITHCRNTCICLADINFLWVYSEANLIEPLIRLRHTLDAVAPIRSIVSIPLAPQQSTCENGIPLVSIGVSQAHIKTLTGRDALQSFEFLVIASHTQAASLVISVIGPVAGLVASLPYLLVQAPVTQMRLLRSPMIMAAGDNSTHLGASVSHGSLRGIMDLMAINFILSVSVSHGRTDAEPDMSGNKDVFSALATLGNYYMLTELDNVCSPANNEAVKDPYKDIIRKPSLPTTNAYIMDNKPNKFARFKTRVVVTFLSGEALTIDWSAKGNSQLAETFKCPLERLVQDKSEPPLLSYNALLNTVQEALIVNEHDKAAHNNSNHGILSCIVIQQHVMKAKAWLSSVTHAYTRDYANILVEQLRAFMAVCNPSIYFSNLITHQICDPHYLGTDVFTKHKPSPKRLLDSDEWSRGIMHSILPRELIQYVTDDVQELGYVGESVLPSSSKGSQIVGEWKKSKQYSIEHLLLPDTTIESSPHTATFDRSRSLTCIPSNTDAVGDESEINVQNLDFLVGLLKAAP